MKIMYGLLIVWISLPVFGEENLLTHHRRIWKEMTSLHGQHDPESQRRKDELRAELVRLRDLAVSPSVVAEVAWQNSLGVGEQYEARVEQLQAAGVAVDGLEVLEATYIDRTGREVEFPVLAGFQGEEYVLIPLARGSEFGARYAGAHFAEAMEDLLAHNELARGRLRYVDPDHGEVVTERTYDRVDRFFDGLGVATGVAGVALIAGAAAALAPGWVPAAMVASVGSLATFGFVTGLASLGVQIKLNADRGMGGKQIDWTGLSFAAAGTALMGLGRFASTVATRFGLLAAGLGLDGAEMTHGVRLAREVYRAEAPLLNPDQRMRLAAQLVVQSVVDGVTRVLLNAGFLAGMGRDLMDSLRGFRPFAPELAYATGTGGSAPRRVDWNRSLQNETAESGTNGSPPTPEKRPSLFRFERKIGWAEIIATPSLLLSGLSLYLHQRSQQPKIFDCTKDPKVEEFPHVHFAESETDPLVAFVRIALCNGGGSNTAVLSFAPHGSIPPLEMIRKLPNGEEEVIEPTPYYELFATEILPNLEESPSGPRFKPQGFPKGPQHRMHMSPFSPPTDHRRPLEDVLNKRVPFDQDAPTPIDITRNIPTGEVMIHYIGIRADVYGDTKVDELQITLDATSIHGEPAKISGRIVIPPRPEE